MRKISLLHKLSFLLVALLTFPFMEAISQPGPADWVPGYANDYLKIRIVNNGVYKISFEQLDNLTSDDLTAVSPGDFRLFHLGREAGYWMEAGQNGVFDSGDFIAFYADGPDGEIDLPLFITPEAQFQKNSSIYNDTSYYYLTWTPGSPGKMISPGPSLAYVDSLKEEYWLRTSVNEPRNAYFDGYNLLGGNAELLGLSYYTEGEGWSSTEIFRGGAGRLTFTVNTENYYPAGPEAVAKYFLAGRNKRDSAGVEPYFHHHVRVWTGPKSPGTQRILDDIYWQHYKTKIKSAPLLSTDIGSLSTWFRFWAIDDWGLGAERSTLHRLEVTYPSSFNMGSNSQYFFELDQKTSGTYHVNVKGSFTGSKYFAVDVTTGKKFTATPSGGALNFAIPAIASLQRIMIADSNALYSPANMNIVRMPDLPSQLKTDPEFIIITSRKLAQSAAEYANYRASTYKTKVFYVEDIYRQFSYGYPDHPLSIKNFFGYIMDNPLIETPKFALLLGKGIQITQLFYDNNIEKDLVPVIGFPPSDNLYVTGLTREKGLGMAFPIGRVAASSDEEVRNYLNKLKAYENGLKLAEITGNDEWRKDYLLISGGRDKAENRGFTRYLEKYRQKIIAPYIGGRTSMISKSSSIPSDETHEEVVINKIENGLTLATYFGHGAADLLEVEIGSPSEYAKQGPEQLPTFFFSGCILGNCFQQETSKGEIFMFYPSRGSILWLAESYFSFPHWLDLYTNQFFLNLSRDNYGEPVGNVLNATIYDFQDTNSFVTDYFSETQILQKILQGDPATRLYSPSKPDYRVTPQQVFLYPADATAESDSFALGIIVNNTAKAINDSLSIRITQTFQDLTTKDYPVLRVRSPLISDTFYFYIYPDKERFAGNNTFTIEVDYPDPDQIPELREDNNVVNFQVFIPSSGVFPLFPKEYSIVPERKVQFIAQSNDHFITNATYEIQIDTSAEFNSPWRKTSGNVLADALIKWDYNLPARDSSVYYWRVRRITRDSTVSSWYSSSFTYIKGSPSGWAQAEYAQYKSLTPKSMNFDTLTKKLKFNRINIGKYNVSAPGDDASIPPVPITINYNGLGGLFFSGLRDGLYVFAVDPENGRRYCYTLDNEQSSAGIINMDSRQTMSDIASGHVNTEWWEYSCFYLFPFSGTASDSTLERLFVEHLRRIPEGYHVMIFSFSDNHMETLSSKFHGALSDYLGATKSETVKSRAPYLLITKKGASPQEVQKEETNDSTSYVAGSMHIYPLLTNGYIHSTIIGPAQRWRAFYSDFKPLEKPTSDSINIAFIGIDPNGKETLLDSGFVHHYQDLSFINSSKYPYIRIRAYLQDKDPFSLTPPQLQNWIVLYDDVPEGTFDPSLGFAFRADTLQQGDSLFIRHSFSNISKFPFDSLKVNFKIADQNRKIILDTTKTYPPLNANSVLEIKEAFSTRQITSTNNFSIFVNPDFDQPEVYLFNNIYERNFYVSQDNIKPILDVTFDGYHIMDGDIVSPYTEIMIMAEDENEFFLLDDTSLVNVKLLRPDGKEQILSFKNDLEFTPAEDAENNKASILYSPEEGFRDGKYKLVVEFSDASGNPSGANAYEKQFEVINKSTITHFYPYPNPFTTQMKFVFTLTGAEVPDKIHIQILTLSGRVVKDIFLEELGDLKIGNNITDYCWDGTDQFGDPLANGVYFYRINTWQDGKKIDHRETAGDNFFKKNIGKIYLMR